METRKKITTSLEICEYLTENNIAFQQYFHPPIFTCEERHTLNMDLPEGADTKNLFLKDTLGQFYLATTLCQKRINLKEFAKQVRVKKFSFGSADELLEYLNVTAGSVTILALVNCFDKKIQFILDTDVLNYSHAHCHPMINSETLWIDQQNLKKFLDSCNILPLQQKFPAL